MVNNRNHYKFKSHLRWQISILEVVTGTLLDWILASVADMGWKGRHQPFDWSIGCEEIGPEETHVLIHLSSLDRHLGKNEK